MDREKCVHCLWIVLEEDPCSSDAGRGGHKGMASHDSQLAIVLPSEYDVGALVGDGVTLGSRLVDGDVVLRPR